MSKEETINIVKDFISYIRFDETPKYGVRKQYMAIENLLDLYEQEKAKNKETEIELEKTTELLTTCNKRLEEISRILGLTEEHQYGYSYSEIKQYIETLIDENNRLENIEDKKIQIEYELVFNKGVKSVKNKIKEKIEEWDKSIKWANADDRHYAIKILNELLEEE